jgi:4-hydroxy-2-oxoheptanedioate aldolase
MSRPGFNPAIGNEQTVCLVMIETVEGFANLEPILDVPGVDGALVGPNDLAISHSGSNAGAGTSERDSEMITEIAKQCALRGLAAATSCRGDEAGRLVALGYTLVALSSDAALLAKALTAELEEARSQQASGH